MTSKKPAPELGVPDVPTTQLGSVLDGGHAALPLTLEQLFAQDLPGIDPAAETPIYDALSSKLSFAGPAEHNTDHRPLAEI